MIYHILPFVVGFCTAYGATASVQQTPIDNDRQTIAITFALQPEEYLYKDYLIISAAHPEVQLSPWTADISTKNLYDETFKEHKSVYTDTVTLTLQAQKPAEASIASVPLHVQYMTNLSKEPQSTQSEIQFATPQTSSISEATAKPTASVTTHQEPYAPQPSFMTLVTAQIKKWIATITNYVTHIKDLVSKLVTTTDSLILQFGAVFILGLLMSLTPCIYPMIPITVGILQTSAGDSLVSNFLLALSYALGMAFTFAGLGFLAAIGSTQFGALLGNPIFVIFLVAFLAYLAFSMLGFYDLYIPRFLQPKDHTVRQGSYPSAFIFGVISGSVASPCLSPGLVLLLSIVATLGNKILGFLLLFSFGVGLSVPLLIIGTFSNSLTVMPRAGLWMVEIKKFFGFMLISMCFYYLSAIFPWHVILWGISGFLLLTGVVYHFSIQPFDTTTIKRFKQLFGTALIIASVVVAIQAFKAYATPVEQYHQLGYAEARQQAQEQQKLLLVDFGAVWCTSCKELLARLMQPKVINNLNHALVTIDCTNPKAASCADLQQKFAIKGFPTIVLIDPATEMVIKRWGSELLDLADEQLVIELNAN